MKDKKEKSRNPHSYWMGEGAPRKAARLCGERRSSGMSERWLFDAKQKKSSQAICSLRRRWRRRWDSNPRAREGYLISSQARYDHFDTPPCVFSPVFSSFLRRDPKPLRKELTERTTEYSIFEPVKNRTVPGFVRYETHSLNGDFESGPL